MNRLDRSHLSTILLLALAVSATGIVASTITDVAGIDRSGPDVTFEPRGEPNVTVENRSVGNTSGNASLDQRQSGVSLQFCVEVLQGVPAVLGIVTGATGILYGVSRRYNAATSLLLATGLVPLVVGSYFLLTNCGYSQGGGGSLFGFGSSIVTNDGAVSAVPVPPTVAVGVFAIVMVVGVVLLFTTTSEDETFEPMTEELDEPDEADFARAAGRAADRIEEANVAVDNAVYRAWREMTSLLNIPDPETATPMDFAEGAIDTGLDEDDVSELTELFNEVRYGGKSPENREERAVAILRNIERTYRESADRTGGDE